MLAKTKTAFQTLFSAAWVREAYSPMHISTISSTIGEGRDQLPYKKYRADGLLLHVAQQNIQLADMCT